MLLIALLFKKDIDQHEINVLSTIADKLTRSDNDADDTIRSFGTPKYGLPISLHNWTLNPYVDHMLGFDIVEDIKNNNFHV